MKFLGCGDMLGRSLETRREPMISCKAAWSARLPKSISGSRGPILRVWLFTILHNQNVNEVRHSVRQGIAVAVEDVAPVLTASPRAGACLQLRDFERAVTLLPEEQRQVILIVGLEGMRYEEVAAVLDIP